MINSIKVSLRLGSIISSFVLALIYYLILTPVALFQRSFSSSVLTQNKEGNISSGWHVQKMSTHQTEIYKGKL